MAQNNNQKRRPKMQGKPDPMSNMKSKGRYGLKLIRDIAYGNFNIYTQGHIFRDMDLVNATLNEVNSKLVDLNIHITAIQRSFLATNTQDDRVMDLLWRDTKAYEAYSIMQNSLSQISATGDVGFLLVMANNLPPLRQNI